MIKWCLYWYLLPYFLVHCTYWKITTHLKLFIYYKPDMYSLLDLKKTKSRRKRSKYDVMLSRNSVWQKPTNYQLTQSNIDHHQGTQSDQTSRRHLQSDGQIHNSQPDVMPLRSVPTTVHYLQHHSSWRDGNMADIGPRESESTRLLPNQIQAEVRPRYPAFSSEDVLHSQRFSSHRVLGPDDDVRMNPEMKDRMFSRTSLPEYDRTMFSQHTIHSEPSRNQPPLPPPPPPLASFKIFPWLYAILFKHMQKYTHNSYTNVVMHLWMGICWDLRET